MQSDNWNRARELFEQVLEAPPAEREAFLAVASGDDHTLLAEVRELLAAFEGDSFLEHPPVYTATADKTAEPPAVPATIGRYAILGALGHGGMGIVYRGRDPQTGEPVAIKTVRAASESLVAGIRREIHALARLSHPGIVRVLDEGLDGGVPWYAMELVDGTSLRSHGSSDLGAMLTLVRRVCETLAFLHGEGIVHRDLKPDNILVRPSGQPVLVDFGISTVFANREGRDALDVLASTGGTLSYMAPEQIRGEHVDARADLYALGCIVYELVAGRPPFAAATVDGLVQAHLSAAPVPPSAFAPDIPDGLDTLVLHLLAKRPADRFGYASDVAAALERLGAEGGSVADGPRTRAYLYRPAFAGRDEALEELDESLERLAAGDGGVVLVGGESGVGKTRLALEVARRAERAGARVLAGECLPSGARAGGALAPLRAPLERVADRCRERGEQETDTLLGPRGRLLARVVPELSGLPGQEKYSEPVDLPPEAARLRLFEALASTLDEVALSRPLLLVLDDLQWADELTLGFLDFVSHVGRPARGRVLLLGTYRGEEQPEAIREILAAGRAARIDLNRLEEPAVAAMVGGMLSLEPSPPVLSGYLSRQSEGNPFFVAEYLRAAVDEGLLWRDEAGAWQVDVEGGGRATEADYERLGLPRSLRALVERRLGGLERDATAVVSAAAVVGREADAGLLERVVGLGGPALLEAIEELRRRQILEDAAGGRLRFTHDKLREAAYEALGTEEHARLHGAAARALETVLGDDTRKHAALLAEHWRAAGELDRARPYYLVAARDATARHANAEAERLYGAFIDLTSVASAERVEARIDLAFIVLRVQGRYEEGVAVSRLAQDDARAIGRRDLESAALKSIGGLLREHGRTDEAAEALDACLAAAREAEDRRAEAAALNGLGGVAVQQGRCEDAERLFRAGISAAVESDDRRSEAVSTRNLALALSMRGDHEAAADLVERSLAINRAEGDRLNEGQDLTNLGYVMWQLGRYEEAFELSKAGLAIHRETGYRQQEGLALGNLAHAYWFKGQPETAQGYYREAIAVLEAAADRYYVCAILANCGALARQLGDYDQAQANGRRALELARRYSSAERVLVCECNLGFTELARGGDAQRRLAEIEAQAASLDLPVGGEAEKALARLRRAVDAFGRGERLFHGEHADDAPEWVRARAGASPASNERGI